MTETVPESRGGRRPEANGQLAAYAAAVAGATDPADLVKRLGRELARDGGRHGSVRLWVFEEDGDPKLVASHPTRARAGRSDLAAVVDAALATEPIRIGPSLLASLRVDGSPLGVLAVGARTRLDAETLRALAPIVAARLQALQYASGEGAPSPALRITEAAADPNGVIAGFAAEAKRLLDHDRLSVYMLTHDGNAVERFAVATSPVLPGETELIPLENLGLTHVLQTNRALVSDDLAADERLVGREDGVIAAGGFRGLVSVPLRVRGKPIGLLNFVSKTPGFYSEEDAVVAQQVADQVAVFFQNLRLEQRIRVAIEREAAQHERNRLAHELHDTLAQSLAELLVRLDLLGKQLADVDAEPQREVAEIRESAQAMLHELRRSLLRLRPAELERQSLEEAMRSALEQLQESHGIKTSLETAGPLQSLPPEIEAAAFRIFQEAIANARKHSGASTITVTLRADEGLSLSIEDNGHGFGQETRHGFGSHAMRERADEIGGRVIISSTSGRGTSVHLSVPTLRGEPVPRRRSTAQPEVSDAPSRVKRVVVVDDHPLFREGLSRLLEREADLRVVAQVGTAHEAVVAVKRLRPDLLVLDVELPDASGIEVLRQFARLDNPPPVLMLSAFPESGHVVAAMKAGARGYVSKTIESDSLLESIRAIARGSTILDSSSGAGVWTPRRLAQLTRRELDVLTLVAAGKTNSDIANDLCLAKKTVERIVASAVSKMRARNRAHAVAKAVSLKLLEPSAD